MVKETDASRRPCKVAVVGELIPSKDNEIRGATIRVVNGKWTMIRLYRPLKVLFALEVNEEQGKTFDTHCSTDDQG